MTASPGVDLDGAKALVAGVVGCAADDIPDNARINRLEGWDSLAQANLMIAVEQATGARLQPTDAVRLISIKTIARFLATTSGGGLEPEAALSAEDLGQAILQGFGDVGLNAGDSVLVHSLAASALTVQDAPRIVVEAMLEALGPAGTLVMPGFTNAFVEGMAFDRRRTPSQMGLLTDWLRQSPDTEVSPHPYHRFFAAGANASALTARHGPSSFGEDSPLDRLRHGAGKILFLSVDWDSCVYLHYVEEQLQVPYRFFKEFTGEVIDGDESRTETWSMYVRDLEGTTNDFLRFGRCVEEAGLVRQSMCGPFVFKSVDTAGLFDFASRMLADDPYCMVAR